MKLQQVQVYTSPNVLKQGQAMGFVWFPERGGVYG